mmetsp:Transcript_29774/g.39131  ORF Transcript_29774/g.39131 Transcript_29774/m.39131 type:complete len:94 (-) Transcript_29774:656-937(-)
MSQQTRRMTVVQSKFFLNIIEQIFPLFFGGGIGFNENFPRSWLLRAAMVLKACSASLTRPFSRSQRGDSVIVGRNNVPMMLGIEITNAINRHP